MEGWDLALLFVAGYVAVTALVRLMLRRRAQMYDDLRRQIEAQKHHREDEEPKPRRKTA